MKLSLDLGLFRKSVYSQLTQPAQIDAMGYAIELAQSMLEKEREIIENAYKQGTCHHGDGYTATEYYEETFNTNEK